jgi:L-ascorbate metabolism protein UlaG (beta-lactamase superfamily)
MELEELPQIDLIVLSHMHEDHFDRVVEQKLDKDLTISPRTMRLQSSRKKGLERLIL